MPVPRDGSKYNMATAPPYQVSFTQSMSGKVFSGSKRRVNFSFGFADPKALESGATGPDARGEEHQVNLIWSVASGKRVVTMDGEEVHFSHGKSMESTFETTWSLGDSGHMVKLVAHSAHALFQPVGFRPFDLTIDGLSFWNMPRIYELGFDENSQPSSSPHTRGVKSSVQSPSIKRSTEHDFARPPPSPGVAYAGEPTPSQRSMNSPTGVADIAALDQHNVTKELKPQVAVDLFDAVAPPQVQQQPVMDDFSPAPPAPPSFEMVSHQVMSAYGAPPSGATPSNPHPPQGAIVPVPAHNNVYQQQPHGFVPATPPPTYRQAPVYAPSPYQQPEAPGFAATPHFSPQPVTPPPQVAYQEASPEPPAVDDALAVQFPLTMEKLSLEDIMDERNAPTTATPTEKALHSLVNLDDLNETFVSPQQRKRVEEREAAAVVRSSKPLPPTVGDWKLGLQPKLAEMQSTTPKAARRPAAKKEIMRMHTPAAAAQAGMMVMYGAPTAAAHPMPMYYQHQQQQQQRL